MTSAQTEVGYNTKIEGDVIVTKVDAVLNWFRKNSLWPMPMGLACCAIELMAAGSSRFDIARFGAEVMRFSPRQSDLMIVAGTVTYKMALAVRRIYDQMAEPKWVIAMGACASTGGMYRSYAVLQGVDRIVPVNVYVAGCPPRPEAVLDGLIELQNNIQNEGPKPNGIAPSAIRHKDQKVDQLNRYFEIPKKEVLENVQNPKSNRISKPGFTYSKNYVNTSPHIGYDSPEMQQKKSELKE